MSRPARPPTFDDDDDDDGLDSIETLDDVEEVTLSSTPPKPAAETEKPPSPHARDDAFYLQKGREALEKKRAAEAARGGPVSTARPLVPAEEALKDLLDDDDSAPSVAGSDDDDLPLPGLSGWG